MHALYCFLIEVDPEVGEAQSVESVTKQFADYQRECLGSANNYYEHRCLLLESGVLYSYAGGWIASELLKLKPPDRWQAALTICMRIAAEDMELFGSSRKYSSDWTTENRLAHDRISRSGYEEIYTAIMAELPARLSAMYAKVTLRKLGASYNGKRTDEDDMRQMYAEIFESFLDSILTPFTITMTWPRVYRIFDLAGYYDEVVGRAAILFTDIHT